jgi:hypothetical protein
MRIIHIIVLLLTVSFQTLGQKQDYKKIQGSLMTLSCGPIDSLTLFQTKARLVAFDTSTVSKNIQLYHYDLGMCYYVLYARSNNKSYLGKAISSLENAVYHQSSYSAALWNLALCNYFLKDCSNSKYYLERYKKVTRRKHLQNDQIKLISKGCES